MSQALYNAMGGINASQSQINVVSNNIANMNTVGFKSSNVTFQDVFSSTLSAGNAPSVTAGGKNPMQIGLGVQIGTIAKNFTTGTFMSTGRALDMAIEGSGFFALRSPEGGMYLSRAGNMTIDAEGNMVNAQGFKVIGAEQLFSSTTSNTNVKVPKDIETSVTGNANLGDKHLNNTNASSITAGTFTLTNDATPPKTVTITIADTDQTMDQMVADINAQITAASLPDAAFATMAVGADGQLQCSSVPATAKLTFEAGTSNFVKQTQFGVAPAVGGVYDSKVLDYVVEVKPAGTTGNITSANNYTVSADGAVEVSYDNGDKLTVELNPVDNVYQFKYTTSTGVTIRGEDVVVNPNVARPANLQIQMVNVPNQDGLLFAGGNLFTLGPNAGEATYCVAGSMGVGGLKANGLEASNVDMAKEFSDMILAQRSIQANSRVFDTASSIMQSLVYMGKG